MLFDKYKNGADELKQLLGFVYASNKFDNLKTDIEIAETKMKQLIGSIFDLAQTHYDSDFYQNENIPEPEGDEEPVDYALRDKLVHMIQVPLAYHAVLSYAPHSDLTHSEKGRQILVTDKEKPAFEWQIERDNKAMLAKAHETTDMLLYFIENYFATEWEAAKPGLYKGLFLESAIDFNQYFPINQSRRLFLHTLPFMLQVQKLRIKAVLGSVLYDNIVDYINTKEASEENTAKYLRIIEVARPAVALLSISLAIRRLSAEILPEGILQGYTAESGSVRASKPASQAERFELSKLIEMDGENELKNLQKLLQVIAAEEANTTLEQEDITDRMHRHHKFFRV